MTRLFLAGVIACTAAPAASAQPDKSPLDKLPATSPPVVIDKTGIFSNLNAKVGELIRLKAEFGAEVTWDLPENVPHYIDEGSKTLVLPLFKTGQIVVSAWTVEDKKPVRAGRYVINVTEDGAVPVPKTMPASAPPAADFPTKLKEAFAKDRAANKGTPEQAARLAAVYATFAGAIPDAITTTDILRSSLNATADAQLGPNTFPEVRAEIARHIAQTLPLDGPGKALTAADKTTVRKVFDEVSKAVQALAK